ncbi:MAG: hypothetical protein JWO19_4465 [Bryobacterales bacterium]|nr:hypothetical protein [Bryobacterales bacterium]
MLLDDCLPEFDVRTSYATRIAASPQRTYASLRTADFDHWGLTRALYAVRALAAFPAAPRETWRRFRRELWEHRFTLEEMLASGFTVIGERPGEELVLGTVGRFGAPAENSAQPVQRTFVSPLLQEPQRQHGTSSWGDVQTALPS